MFICRRKKINENNTKKRILTTAKQLMKERGFDNVSIDSVVKGAGISKGAFYVHFESKDALAAILIANIAKESDTSYQSLYDAIDSTMNITDKLLLFVEKVAAVIESIGCDNMKVLYKIHLTSSLELGCKVW